MDAQIATIVSSFAKQHKYSKAKLEALVSTVIESMPKRAVSTGKPVSEEGKRIRSAIVTIAGKHTAKEYATMLECTPANATNTLKWLARQGKAEIVGKGEKPAGQRGKTPMLWVIKG